VWKVEMKKTKRFYAMKEMLKARVLTKKSVKSVMNERMILSQMKSDFIVNMYYSFQDRDHLYLVLDLLPGGDLRYHIGRRRKFNEEQAKFIIACIIEGLAQIHRKGFIHRDIKPENLVFDLEG
jgi:serine/threonine kinase 32